MATTTQANYEYASHAHGKAEQSSTKKILVDLTNSPNAKKPKTTAHGKKKTPAKKTLGEVTIHPEAGKPLTKTTARCRCGGITGICGFGQGSTKWRAHIATKKHKSWEASYVLQQQRLAAGAKRD